MKCPYESTSSRKCTHKGVASKQTRRKRFCGYGDPRDCPLFQEWLELVTASNNVAYNAPMDFLDIKEKEDDIKKS